MYEIIARYLRPGFEREFAAEEDLEVRRKPNCSAALLLTPPWALRNFPPPSTWVPFARSSSLSGRRSSSAEQGRSENAAMSKASTANLGDKSLIYGARKGSDAAS